MESAYPVLALLVGMILGFLIRKFIADKNSVDRKVLSDKEKELNELKQQNYHYEKESETLKTEIARQNNNFDNLQAAFRQTESDLISTKEQNKQLAKETEKYKVGAENDQAFIQDLSSENTKLKEEKATLSASLKSLQENHAAIRKDFSETKAKLDEQIERFTRAKEELSHLSEQNKHLSEKLNNERKDLENIKSKFTNEFKVLADKILEEKSKKFTDQNKHNIEGILTPLGKEIADFRKKVEETYTNETRERHSLEKAIQQLAEQNIRISEEAQNLTRALKGSSKQQGDWGEMILESILEQSGLQKDREYFVQDYLRDQDGNTITGDSGRRLQPDIRIHYPGGKGNIIIDSKVSLTAYERFANAETAEEQKAALTEHLISLKKHIDELANKKYHDYTEGTDFTMMFVPVEPAYMIAIQADVSLWNYAYRKRIILISPTNLIAALKLVKDMWERKYQNDYAMEIADRGGKLYDKFVNFAESLNEIGDYLEKTRQSHDKAVRQLTEGRGNLVRQAEQLKELRVKSEKQIPSNFLDKADD